MPQDMHSFSQVLLNLSGAYPPCPSSPVPERHNIAAFDRLNRSRRDSVNPWKKTACTVTIIHGTGGWPFAENEPAMNPSIPIRAPRRKAVWGPKRTLAALAVVALGLATNAFAEGPHARRGTRLRAGRPNAEARNHRKLDRELSVRSAQNSAQSKTKVIVTLKDGAELPAEFKKFGNRRLGIINGQALSLPNGLIKRLSEYPEVFDIRLP
jgi:hypothetical protein